MMYYKDDFLDQLQLQQHKTIYARVTLLAKDGRPLDWIEGKVVGGNVNVDGASAVRRTCSIQMISEEINVSNYLWSLESKFQLEIGLNNDIDSNYSNIIWFPQGIFIVTNFSSQLNAKSYQISINGKDKMCLLNGEVGGTFNSQIDFGKLEIKDKNGNIKLIKLPVKKIIREMIHQYGGEPFSNIIINDLDDTGLELMEYRLKQPLYIWRRVATGEKTFDTGTLDINTIFYLKDGKSKTIASLEADPKFYFDTLIDDPYTHPTEIFLTKEDKTPYYMAKISYGEAAGYKETELVYPGDLIAKAGETITSVLDKIKKMLSMYEYFYNLEGQFIFQKKKDYRQIAYTLEGSKLITAFNNTPDLKNAKNDFTVWGNRKTISGAEIPIHMRKAIQKKPTQYTTIQVSEEELVNYNKAYDLNVGPQESITYTSDEYDWREILYRMSLDYRKYNHLDDFELKIIKANPTLYPSGTTGYEQYYIDMEGFWRQLYNPGTIDNVKPKVGQYFPWQSNDKPATKDTMEIINIQDKKGIIKSTNLSQKIKTEKNSPYITTGMIKASVGTKVIIHSERYAESYWGEEKYELYWDDKKPLTEVKLENEFIFPMPATEAYIYQGLEGDGFVCSFQDGTKEKIRIIKSNEPQQIEIKGTNPLVKIERDSLNKNNQIHIRFLQQDYIEVKGTDKWEPFYFAFNSIEDLNQKDCIYFDGAIDENGNIVPFELWQPEIFGEGFYSEGQNKYWKQDVIKHPENLNFYIDFIDTEGILNHYSNEAIGNRPKVSNNSGVKAISYREIPFIIFDKPGPIFRTGYRYFNIPNFENAFSISPQGKCALDEINYLLSEYSFCLESVSITSIPIYNLDPNILIYINDLKTGINGNYTIKKFNLSLTHKGTMSITAVKQIPNIY